MENTKVIKNVFSSKEEYLAFVAAWKKNVVKGADTTSLCFYAALRGRDWKSGLSPHTNEEFVKLLYWRLNGQKLGHLDLSMFDETVKEEHINKLRENGVSPWE